eukprot:349945-Chlamydomonas_euryale.AAC.7
MGGPGPRSGSNFPAAASSDPAAASHTQPQTKTKTQQRPSVAGARGLPAAVQPSAASPAAENAAMGAAEGEAAVAARDARDEEVALDGWLGGLRDAHDMD